MIIFTNKKVKEIKKIRRQDHYFSTRLPYSHKKIREIWRKMNNTTNKSSEDTIIKLQELKGQTKLNFYHK